MRGKGQPQRFSGRCKGITPAYAGKRLLLSNAPFLCWDHPRLCGEKSLPAQLRRFFRGSPPPMRGKGPPVADMWKRSGITTAYAGKRYHKKPTVSSGLDHHRLCGEKSLGKALQRQSVGSPPPMRGKAGKSMFYARPNRITPAYAGKSCRTFVPLLLPWDHPRLCGEKRFASENHGNVLGSPPPMRGKAVKHLKWP